MLSARPCLLALVLPLVACVGPFLFTDGSSVSHGTFNDGLLRKGRKLPAKAEGFQQPSLWARRGNSWGVDELVGAILRASARVSREYPGSYLGVGDLSQKGGGHSELHRSHENGRDADMLFYAVDKRGKPVRPAGSMPRYISVDGPALPPRPPSHGVVFESFSPRNFDVQRNWSLVRALLQDPEIDVQFLFISTLLKQGLLDYARSISESENLIERADALLRQPGDSLPHDDHLHLRIFCAADDRPLGCNDRGALRWWKKREKQMAPYGTEGDAEELVMQLLPTFESLRASTLSVLALRR